MIRCHRCEAQTRVVSTYSPVGKLRFRCRRIRKCPQCGFQFHTVERRIELSEPDPSDVRWAELVAKRMREGRDDIP